MVALSRPEPLISQVWPLAGFEWKPVPFIGTWAGHRYVGGAMAQGATTLVPGIIDKTITVP